MSHSVPFNNLIEAARSKPPSVVVVLGSGMGGIAARLTDVYSLPFVEVPGLAATSVVGHSGRLSLGHWAGRRVLVLEGRQHYYECGSWRDVVASIHIARFLGVQTLLTTNAAGGIHPSLDPGRLMVVRDHIEWTRPGCWRRAPGMNRPSPYSDRLRRLLLEVGQAHAITLHEGVYAAVTGPCYETPAEVRALKAWGADAVGMSTAREVQEAHDHGLECVAVSLITNRAAGLCEGPIHHEEVLSQAAAGAEQLACLMEKFLERAVGDE